MNYYKQKLPELLAPAGSFEHLKAAVLAGADAVYFGGSRFGARAYAENFTKEKVIEGLDYVHFHDRRAYMTVNTLVKEKELQEELYDYLLPFYEAGLDGVIVQDLGAASFIRNHFPEMEIHGSTQMMITGVPGALKAKEMGMNRIVPARELSMEEVARIKEESGLEVEVFIHGALCYCYSGQCLFSSMYGGRSGNRGRCAQPCRLPYRLLDENQKYFLDREKHLLSPKDLYSLTTLPSMIEHGVDSLKIEGRMKNVEYVAGVTSIYRKYLDQYDPGKKWIVDSKDQDILMELYSRSGFTNGYWNLHNGTDMMSIETPRHLGLLLGSITGIQKNRLFLTLSKELHSKDLIVIPGPKDEEIVLTVPNDLSSILKKKKKGWEIVLNAPKCSWLKPGIPVYRRYNEELQEKIHTQILQKKLEYPVTASINITQDKAIHLDLSCRDTKIHIEGEKASLAQNRPIEEKDILKQMKKTGNVPFYLSDFDITLDKGLFVQASMLKDLRQKAYEELENAKKASYHRSIPSSDSKEFFTKSKEVLNDLQKIEKAEYIAAVYNEDDLVFCLEDSFFDGIVLSMDFEDAFTLKEKKSRIHAQHKKAYLSMPHVLRQESEESLTSFLRDTISDQEDWDGIYLHNINEIALVEKLWPSIPRIYGASFYQWNHESREEIARLDSSIAHQKPYWELPFELSAKECIASISSESDSITHDNYECLVYGRFPVMISAQCLKKTLGKCNHTPQVLSLEDRKKGQLPVSTHCKPGWTDPSIARSKKTALSCYNMIWTKEARNLIGEDYFELSERTRRYRFDFFHTSKAEIKTAIQSFKEWKKNSFLPFSHKKSQEDHWNFGIE